MSEDMGNCHHVGVVVQDIEASIAWYVDRLGFERGIGFPFPGGQLAFVKRGAFRIEFFQVEGAAPMAAERETGASNLKIGGINHFAIQVADVDRTVAELESKGVEVASPPKDVPGGRGERYAFVRDNERMLVELFQSAD